MPKFLIGDVVAIHSHPFSQQTTDVLISGEYLMIPPLMIIVEIIDHCIEESEKDRVDKYKCIWFSTKKNHFNESYFAETDLKKIEVENDDETVKIGSLVSLITLPLELGKRRSFLSAETNQTGDVKSASSVTGLLSFVSPVMTVIEIKEFDPKKDKKTAPEIRPKKIYPHKLAKCKWFDSVAEKFSECLIAMEALTVIQNPPSRLLSLIDRAISDQKYLKLEGILIRPIQISNRSGKYYLNCFNFVSQLNSTLPLDELTGLKIATNNIKAIAPLFKSKMEKGTKFLKLTVSVETLIKKAIKRSNRNYITIKYEDRSGNITKRTISKYELILGDDDRKMDGPMVKYIKAYCHLRNAERHFRLASVSEATELKLVYKT